MLTLSAVLPLMWATWTNNVTLAVCAVMQLGLVEAEKAIRKANVSPAVRYASYIANAVMLFVVVFSYVASTLVHM